MDETSPQTTPPVCAHVVAPSATLMDEPPQQKTSLTLLQRLGLGFTWVTTLLAAPLLGLLWLIASPFLGLFWLVGKICKKNLCPCALLKKVGERPLLAHPVTYTLRWIVFILWRCIASILGLLLWIVIASALWAVCVFLSAAWLKILIVLILAGCLLVAVMKCLPLAQPPRWIATIQRIPLYHTTLCGALTGWLVLWLILLNTTFTNVGPLVRAIAVPVANSIGCDLTLETLDICPLEGRLTIKGLRVEQPRAFIAEKPDVYTHDPLLALGEFTLHVDLPSLFKDGAFTTQDIRIKTFTLTGLKTLIAWDNLVVDEDETVTVTNIDALLIQMGLKSLPTAEEQVEANEAEVLEEVKEEVDEAEEAIAKKEAELNAQLAAVKVETDKAVATGAMTQQEADAKVEAEERHLRETLEAYKAEWTTKVTIEKLCIRDNGITLYWGSTILPINPTIPVVIPPLEMENVSSDTLQKTYMPVIDTCIEVYDLFEGFRVSLGKGITDVFSGLSDIGKATLEGLGSTLSGATEVVSEGLSTATEAVTESVSATTEAATETISDAWNNLTDIISSEESTTEDKKEDLKDLGKRLKEDGKDLGERLKTDGKDLGDQLKKDAKSALEGLKSFF